MGMGARMGRGARYCEGFGMPGYANPAGGRGLGMGFGRGRGFGGRGGGGCGWLHLFYATGLPGWMRFGGWTSPYQKPDPEPERQAIEDQARALQTELDFIKKRLGDIETGAESK